MSAARRFSMRFPKSGENGDTTVESNGVTVIVGANGCGKTRLGVWIKQNSGNPPNFLRVSAQKSLALPSSATINTSESAERKLRSNQSGAEASPVEMQNDFGGVMNLLFSKRMEQSTRYLESSRASAVRVDPPETTLDAIKTIWEAVLPRRELVIGELDVKARVRGKSAVYQGTQLSDGERVVFYLAGRCLLAPPGGVLVIDEPEMHLHKLIQAKFWDAIEGARPDCHFVYLTHDLEFAASRRGATKVWLKEFDGKRWDWSPVPEGTDIPEELLLAVIGSRKPVLFVEGTRSSWDWQVYAKLYPERTVVPCGGVEPVIRAASAFNARQDLHALKCWGLIDRDHRSDERIEHLHRRVRAIDVCFIENLFLIEHVLRAVIPLRPEGSVSGTPDELIDRVKRHVLTQVREDREGLMSRIAVAEIESKLKHFDAKARGLEELTAAMDSLVQSVNVSGIYQRASSTVDTLLANDDYHAALKWFKAKTLLDEVYSSILGVAHSHEFLAGLLSKAEGAPVVTAMRSAVPTLAD